MMSMMSNCHLTQPYLKPIMGKGSVLSAITDNLANHLALSEMKLAKCHIICEKLLFLDKDWLISYD